MQWPVGVFTGSYAHRLVNNERSGAMPEPHDDQHLRELHADPGSRPVCPHCGYDQAPTNPRNYSSNRARGFSMASI